MAFPWWSLSLTSSLLLGRKHHGLSLCSLSPNIQALPPGCAWLMAPTGVLAVWRCGMAGAGGRCVTTPGTCGTPPWPASSWAAGPPWPRPEGPSLGRGPDPSSWMIFVVEETRRPCGSAHPGPGASTTVITGRMLGPCVTVRDFGRSRQAGVAESQVENRKLEGLCVFLADPVPPLLLLRLPRGPSLPEKPHPASVPGEEGAG